MIEELDNRTSFIRFKLKINCRNTKFIGDEIKCITGFDSGAYIWSKIEGVPVEHKIFTSQEEERRQLEDLISKLISDGISAENITVLSPYKRENSVIAEISNTKIRDYTPKTDGKVTFSTIQAYKGLENTVIIMTDVESFEHEQLMYVGLSRARSGLFILESSGARKEYLDIQRRRFLEDGYKA
jgi:superfamily I DNA/RNA helicase